MTLKPWLMAPFSVTVPVKVSVTRTGVGMVGVAGAVVAGAADEGQGEDGGTRQEHYSRSVHLLSKKQGTGVTPIVPAAAGFEAGPAGTVLID